MSHRRLGQQNTRCAGIRAVGWGHNRPENVLDNRASMAEMALVVVLPTKLPVPRRPAPPASLVLSISAHMSQLLCWSIFPTLLPAHLVHLHLLLVPPRAVLRGRQPKRGVRHNEGPHLAWGERKRVATSGEEGRATSTRYCARRPAHW